MTCSILFIDLKYFYEVGRSGALEITDKCDGSLDLNIFTIFQSFARIAKFYFQNSRN